MYDWRHGWRGCVLMMEQDIRASEERRSITSLVFEQNADQTVSCNG